MSVCLSVGVAGVVLIAKASEKALIPKDQLLQKSRDIWLYFDSYQTDSHANIYLVIL